MSPIGFDSTVTFQLLLAVVAIVVPILIAFGGLWWRLEARFAAAATDRAGIAKELADYKLHVAEHYAVAFREAMEAQSLQLRRDFRQEMEKLGDRIERIEDHLFNGGRAARRRGEG